MTRVSKFAATAASIAALAAVGACATDDPGPDCKDGRCDKLGEFPDGAQYDRFRGFRDHVAGIPGLLPPNEQLAPRYRGLSELERHGLATWHLYAGDGRFLREISLAGDGMINALRTLDSRERDRRFDSFGVFNDPGCRVSKTPNEFGLFLDECDDPYSSGVLGMRLKPNPRFDQASWDAIGGAEGHFSDKEFEIKGKDVLGWQVEPPYLPSLACTLCHLAPDPLNPPVDVNNPQWDEIVFSIGNQYFREGALLGSFLPDDEFARQMLFSQPPGTSDTSRVFTDHIFNPGTMNTIADLQFRPTFVERVAESDNPDAFDCPDGDGKCVNTFHVLKDGGDSSGLTGAVLRVFLNVGVCTDQMLRASGNSYLRGEVPQTPVSRADLRRNCSEYKELFEQHVEPLLAFLISEKPAKLADARDLEGCTTPQGAPCLTTDEAVIDRGKQVFAERCATCHSSIQPDDPDLDVRNSTTWFTESRNAFFREEVKKDSFWEANFFADGRRYPVNTLGVNAARAFATNALSGHIWAEFSSESYKQSAAVPQILVSLPFIGPLLTVDAPEGGRGYYRTPTLINSWSSAPFFHNNGLGEYNGRVDLEGRIAAYEDAAAKLLTPALRPGEDTIRRTTAFSWLDANLLVKIPIPEGSPIDLFANLGAAIGRGEVSASDFLGSLASIYDNLKEYLQATDLVQDRGHNFGSTLPGDDKHALIELLKTL